MKRDFHLPKQCPRVTNSYLGSGLQHDLQHIRNNFEQFYAGQAGQLHFSSRGWCSTVVSDTRV